MACLFSSCLLTFTFQWLVFFFLFFSLFTFQVACLFFFFFSYSTVNFHFLDKLWCYRCLSPPPPTKTFIFKAKLKRPTGCVTFQLA